MASLCEIQFSSFMKFILFLKDVKEVQEAKDDHLQPLMKKTGSERLRAKVKKRQSRRIQLCTAVYLLALGSIDTCIRFALSVRSLLFQNWKEVLVYEKLWNCNRKRPVFRKNPHASEDFGRIIQHSLIVVKK